jgi:hypothetical protein
MQYFIDFLGWTLSVIKIQYNEQQQQQQQQKTHKTF